WTNADARSALLNYVYLHSDQILKVEIPVNPFSDDYYQWIEGRNVIEIKTGLTFMARCLNVQKALEGLPASQEGRAVFRIEDSLCEWNNQTLQLEAEGDSLIVESLGDARVDTVLSIEGISALAYGTLTISELLPYGWIDGTVPKIMKDWFPRAYVWMYENY
ncbi:MAG: sterol carrier protein domain-containing protein, partial [Candidatus Thorarchaeota archaeon]